MADITFGDLIALILKDLSQTLEQTENSSELLKLHVSDLDLEIPAYLCLQAQSQDESQRLMVGLPSTRKTPTVGKLGRIRITIQPQQLPPFEL